MAAVSFVVSAFILLLRVSSSDYVSMYVLVQYGESLAVPTVMQ